MIIKFIRIHEPQLYFVFIIFTVVKNKLDVNWEAVEAQIDDIRTIVSLSLDNIRGIANSDDETIGTVIGIKLDEAEAIALDIFTEVDREVQEQTLNVESAMEYLHRLKKLLLDTHAKIADDVNQLSETASETIKNTFIAALDLAQAEAQRLYELLQARINRA